MDLENIAQGYLPADTLIYRDEDQESNNRDFDIAWDTLREVVGLEPSFSFQKDYPYDMDSVPQADVYGMHLLFPAERSVSIQRQVYPAQIKVYSSLDDLAAAQRFAGDFREFVLPVQEEGEVFLLGLHRKAEMPHEAPYPQLFAFGSVQSFRNHYLEATEHLDRIVSVHRDRHQALHEYREEHVLRQMRKDPSNPLINMARRVIWYGRVKEAHPVMDQTNTEFYQ